MLFDQTCHPPECDESEYFGSLGLSFLSMLSLLTTANFPDVMISSYTYNRLFAIPFVVFLLFGLFFVMNVVLASVYSNYKRGLASRASHFRKSRQVSLDMAYDLLLQSVAESGPGAVDSGVEGIPVSMFGELIKELSAYGDHREFRQPCSNNAEKDTGCTSYINAAINHVDQNHDGFISREEFRELCVLLPRGFTHAQHDATTAVWRRSLTAETCTQRHCSRVTSSAAFRNIRRWMHLKRFEYCMHALIIINSVIIFIELSGSDDEVSQWLQIVELAFSVIYFSEMCMKICILGIRRYWRAWRHIFDGTISMLGLAMELLLLFPSGDAIGRDAVRFIMFARILRVLRIFSDLSRFSVIFSAFFELIPAFSKLGMVLLLIMCLFGQIATDVFGGKIYPANPALTGTEFAQLNYFACNFNDFASAVMTLFVLLIRNNWTVIMEGTVSVSSSPSRIFFLLYDFVAVVVIFNLVIAYVLERYDEQVEFVLQRLEADFGEDKVDEARLIFAKYSRDNAEGLENEEQVVALADLRNMMLDLGIVPTVAEMEGMLHEFDTDGDGVLQEDEFITLLSNQSSDRYMQLLQAKAAAVFSSSADIDLEMAV
eukprot:COSAG01_NODE_127_length_24940_cov_140.519923_7_plen_600_part_00